MKTLTTAVKLAACAALALGLAARAEDKPAGPAGTWVWSVPARNGGPDRTNTLMLKVEGDKLTGTLSSPGRGGETRTANVEDGKVTTNGISFTITREFNGNTFVAKYSGAVSGDTLKGKIEFERNGETRSRDWEARRQPANAEPGGGMETK